MKYPKIRAEWQPIGNSNIDVKNAAVENIANVIEIFDCLIASKKVSEMKKLIGF